MKRITLFFVALFATIVAFAQVNPNAPLEKDPAVRYGHLENGLTYYIRHNATPANRAEYFLLTDVGAIQETPAQSGLAHFLEHMALNGTKNLPGKMLIEYLQSIGASFGGNINASTGVEQTMYMLNNIPTTRQGIIDTALLIMHDYSGFVTNDPVEIDKERGVIIEEWRTRRTADWRMMEKRWETLYTGSKYATCNLIGSKDNLETFPAKELQDFYHTWYRPDLQAVVVVGDIDVDAVEAQLKELFKDIPVRETPNPKEYFTIPDNDEPIVGIITDPEARNTSVGFFVKSQPMSKQYKALGIGLMTEAIENVIAYMMYERFSDIAAQPNAPFLAASAYFTNLIRTCDAFSLGVNSKDGEAITAFNAALTEVKKAQQFGFTQAEYDRAKAEILRAAESATANADSRKNSEFIGDYIEDFFHGKPFMAPAYEEQQLKGYFELLTIEQINQIFASVPMDKNVVILYTAPEKEGLVQPTKEDFLNTIAAVKQAEVKANVQEEVFEPLVDASVLKGSRVKKETEGQFNTTVWTLKNGIKVIVRPSDTKKDEVLFSLTVDGGTSLVPEEDMPSFDSNVLYFYQNLCGVSKFPQTKLSKMLTGKMVNVSPSIGEITHGLSGSCSPKDFETMMQLAYLQVCDPRFVEEEFAPGMAQMRSIVPNLEKQPNYSFNKHYLETSYNSPRKQIISSEALDKISFKYFAQDYRCLYSNMAGATVIIAGNVDLVTIKPLVEKYIGSLPVARKASTYIDHNLEYVPGKVADIFSQEMQTPKTTSLMIYSCNSDYNIENYVLAQSLQYVMDLVYTESIREEEGGTYGVGVQCGLTSLPKSQASYLFQFDADSDKAASLLDLATKGFEDIVKNGPTEEQMIKVKENLLKSIPEARITNSYWRRMITTYDKTGVDLDTEIEATINGLTAEKVQKFAAQLLEQGNTIKVVMNPSK